MLTRFRLASPSLLLVSACVGAAALAGVAGTRHLERMTHRVERLEGRFVHDSRSLEEALDLVREDLESVRRELYRAQATEAVAEVLANRLAGAEIRLVDIASAIEAHGSSLEVLTEASSFGSTLEQRMAVQAREMTELWQTLRSRVDMNEELATENLTHYQTVSRRLSEKTRDVVRMWDELVGPTVQLSGENSVGSGVLLRSKESGRTSSGTPIHDTYVLTAWHVVRDIVEGDFEMPIPVSMYRPDGTIVMESATLLAHDAGIDAAILRLDLNRPVDYGADLATRTRLEQARIFERIYAVGCPLGNDPIPTPGEIATRKHVVDNVNYWMINAPTYIGNSGGGIFDAQTHELLGIFSKIYTHGALRPTIVPHMGLVTPLGPIYDWLEEEGYAHIVPVDAPTLAEASSTGGADS
jgi:hypothetical protein